jgi:predicted unusual protein kinase regulating ubiquinone biosynthesis (AarF/ABC1/UbiB family)
MNKRDLGGQGANEPPASPTARGIIVAKSGLKVGANYARYLSRRAIGKNKQAARNELYTRSAEDIFSELAKLKGTALKMAQGVSLEPGFLPEQFTEVLARAQYEVPPIGPALVRRLVTKAFGAPPEHVFLEFSPTAMAAASLGQVHRARLKDGTDVVVKVQYPNVRESVDSDLKLIRGIAGRFVDSNAIAPFLNEVRERMMEETDYLQEGRNMDLFADRFDLSKVVVPKWIPDYTTERVLTMTYVEGVHMREFLNTNPAQEDRNHFGQLLWDTVHTQITGDRLDVHADAHPGNFLFREDGKLGVLDFGCIKRFPQDFRDGLLRLYRAKMAGDRPGQEQAFEELDILTPEQSQDERAFVIENVSMLGHVIDSMYRDDVYDFGDGVLLAQIQSVLPKLTGRGAMTYRKPVGSHHFVFVNRLIGGMLSMLTKLGAVIDTRFARERMSWQPTSP